ncbi:MAG: glycoside hydrolase family protein [Cyanobacteria bacterium P01_F01_bin.150]
MGKQRSRPSQPLEVSATSDVNPQTQPETSKSGLGQLVPKLVVVGLFALAPVALTGLISMPFMLRLEPLLREWWNPLTLELAAPEPQILMTPLVMRGGDPYVRALMRTISASEANYARPYSIMYGGRRISDLSRHPNRCYPIESGPNVGLCTTAAGRYQFITPTWELVAQKYHSQRSPWWWKSEYSFEAYYQDQVVHDWLSDSSAWSGDIPSLLRQNRISDVFKILAPTWTSLSSGIEENSITPYLHRVYQEALAQELAQPQ